MKFPNFYNPNNHDKLYMVDSQAIQKEAMERLTEKRNSEDRNIKIGYLGIDQQNCFCNPLGSLFVPGAVEDNQRLVEWIYTNIEKIDQLIFTLDTHTTFQIFHPAFWINEQGEHPEPFTMINLEDIDKKKWIPTSEKEKAIDYITQLESRGEFRLIIWPYHALVGSIEHALVPTVMEAAIFHTHFKSAQSIFEFKGQYELSEMYSVFGMEVESILGKKVGEFNERLFNLLMTYDRIYIAGQAKSHCVKSSLDHLISRIKKVDPAMISKLFLLEDATSPVIHPEIDFETIANKAYEQYAKDGCTIVKTTDSI